MKLNLKRGVIVGFVLMLVVIGGLGVYSYIKIQQLIDTTGLLGHTLRVINTAERLLVLSLDLETGQRGFVITGDAEFLEPYDSARVTIDRELKLLEALTLEYPKQHKQVQELRGLIAAKLANAIETVEARKENLEKAQGIVATGDGRRAMKLIREKILSIKQAEREAYNKERTLSSIELRRFQYTFVVFIVLPALIVAVLILMINGHFSERQKYEKHLRRASDEISHLNKELESFTYSVSHDLRAPLRSINGYSEILKEDYAPKLDEEGTRVIDVIINNARRMGQLIDDLLDFSRLGRKDLSRSSVNNYELVKGIIADLSDQNGALKTKFNLAMLPTSSADLSMIKQVWVNLVSNAVKYSGKNENPMVEIGSFAENGEVCYFVRDNGVGFNMEYKDKLFGVFQRLHKSTEFEGTGVGLALVKRIVSKHGGRVWAEAKINEGATFFFSLPK